MTKKTKLTPAQIAVLRELAAPGAQAHYTPYMGWFSPSAYWRVNGKKCKTQVEKLLSLGYLKTNHKHGYEERATITQQGRDALTALDAKATE